jgi:hypothetical protein
MADKKEKIADKRENPKVNIDGTEYDLDQLSDKAKNIIIFVQRLDKETAEMRFQLDKVTLARKQATIDLKDEIKDLKDEIKDLKDETSDE